jgi:integrase
MEHIDMPRNMERRGAVYYARKSTPKAYRKSGEKKEIWRSLRTTDFNLACERLPNALVEIQKSWLVSPKPEKTATEEWIPEHPSGGTLNAEIRAFIAAQVYEGALAKHDKEYLNGQSLHDQLEAAEKTAVPTDCRLGEAVEGLISGDVDFSQFSGNREETLKKNGLEQRLLQAALSKNDPSLILHEIDALLWFFGISGPREGEDYELFVNYFLRARLAAAKTIEQRLLGNFDDCNTDSAVTEFYDDELYPDDWSVPISEQALSANTLDQLYEKYREDNPRRISDDSMDQGLKSLYLLEESMTSPWTPDSMTREAIRVWKRYLVKLPIRAKELSCFKDKSLIQIVESSDAVGRQVISDRTINKHIAHVGAFSKWLLAEGLIDDNPVEGMALPKEITSTRRSFKNEELELLFNSPLFTGCKNNSAIHLVGDTVIRDHRYWLPILAINTGARLGELAQLLTSDVVKIDDIWVLDIANEFETDKRIKNPGSRRVIPLHSRLIDLGFLDHVECSKAAGNSSVFPEVSRNSRGQIGASFSRRFGKYLAQIGLKTDRSLTFHSFRHTVPDHLRIAGFSDHMIGMLLGHSNQSMTSRYGQVSEGNLLQRKQMIDALLLEGVHFK